ncbi:MAG: alpha/beta hydrolase [Mucilaginibacter sp.]|uniref:alpha/beta hydrolase n=1 Tax=Mucilaginibacter sp. TaxID=1882438 RepID=UPI0034E3B5EB
MKFPLLQKFKLKPGKTAISLPICAIALAAVSFTACNSGAKTGSTSDTTKGTATTDTSSAKTLTPKGSKPAWAPNIKPEMAVVIEKLTSYGDKPIETLTAVQARKNHTPTDAVMAVMKENNIPMPAPKVDTVGKEIPVAGGNIHIRIYTPKEGKAPFPVIVYYHGGGFVIANIDVYNASAQAMAEQVGAIVVSVAYRLAPEHKFPTAHDDAYAAYAWTVKNAASIKGDPKKIAVLGESAGGNLAVATAIKARDNGIMLPTHIVSVYPIAQSDTKTDSYMKQANDKPLNKPMMIWFTTNYTRTPADAKDPRLSLVDANLKGLPPTTIITDEYDPLHDDGTKLADKLKSAGVNVTSRNYDGVTHEFFGMATVVPQAKEAQAFAAGELKKAFGM